ncbi:hypothetical protein D3C86_2244220 [compost metagenome]
MTVGLALAAGAADAAIAGAAAAPMIDRARAMFLMAFMVNPFVSNLFSELIYSELLVYY